MSAQIEGAPRQIVRRMGPYERIPVFSTSELLLRPILSESKPLTAQEIKIKQSHERFAPHIKAINKMRKAGVSLRGIARELGINHKTMYAYVEKNPELFK